MGHPFSKKNICVYIAKHTMECYETPKSFWNTSISRWFFTIKGEVNFFRMDTNLRNDLKVESSKVRNTDTAYQKPVLQSTDNSKGTHSIRSDSMLPNVQTILSTVHSIDNQTPVLNSTVHVNNPVTVQKPSYRRNIPLPVQYFVFSQPYIEHPIV